VRLLLDELYSRRIAELLRDQGHDVIAVTERPDLVGLNDAELFARVQAERRAIVTENWGDFKRLLDEATVAGVPHCGVLFTSRRQLPRSQATIGLYVQVLAAFLETHLPDNALLNTWSWLPDKPFE
jgi:predicted nuclease of predicted toxin-antitoxin system